MNFPGISISLCYTRLRKRIVIAFRGSNTNDDWGINLSAQMTEMETPKLLLREELDGKYGTHTLVHRGFYGERGLSLSLCVRTIL